MYQFTLKAGTIVKIKGVPIRIVEDAKAETGTGFIAEAVYPDSTFPSPKIVNRVFPSGPVSEDGEVAGEE